MEQLVVHQTFQGLGIHWIDRTSTDDIHWYTLYTWHILFRFYIINFIILYIFISVYLLLNVNFDVKILQCACSSFFNEFPSRHFDILAPSGCHCLSFKAGILSSQKHWRLGGLCYESLAPFFVEWMTRCTWYGFICSFDVCLEWESKHFRSILVGQEVNERMTGGSPDWCGSPDWKGAS